MNIIKDDNLKVSFIGISLGGLSTTESAAAVIDENSNIILLDKLFSMNDVKYFIENFAGKQNSVFAISVPDNEVMISSKWKYNSRTYDVVNFDVKMKNIDGWTNRFSPRGSEYFKELSDKGIDIFRYDTKNMKQIYGNCSSFQDRTPIDCKALQDTLRIKYNMRELPVNMLPVAQLEAILGAVLARMVVFPDSEFECKIIGEFENLPVVGI